MRKIVFALILTALLLSACGGKTEESTTTPAVTATEKGEVGTAKQTDKATDPQETTTEAKGDTSEVTYNKNDVDKLTALLKSPTKNGAPLYERIADRHTFDFSDPKTLGLWNGKYCSLEWKEIGGEMRLTRVAIFYHGTNEVDLSGCTELTFLAIDWCKALNVNGCSALSEISVDYGLQEFEWDGCDNLTFLRLNAPRFKELTIDKPLLQIIRISETTPPTAGGSTGEASSLNMKDEKPTLTSLDLSACNNLEYLIYEMHYKSVLTNLSLPKSLKSLALEYAPIQNLDLTECAALEKLYLDRMPVETFSGSFPELKTVKINSCQLKKADISECPKLEEASFYNNKNLTELVLGEHPALKKLECREGQLKEIDISRCPLLNKEGSALYTDEATRVITQED